MTKQSYLPGFHGLGIKRFGGTDMKGNPRGARPLSMQRSLHVVMRSSLAVQEHSFLRNKKKIHSIVERAAKTQGVKLYRFANSGNHLHLIILPSSRRAYISFIRAISGVIARITMGVERGRGLGKKFWDARPFTRILEWGRDFNVSSRYLIKNTLEALGFIPYAPRKSKMRARESPPRIRR